MPNSIFQTITEKLPVQTPAVPKGRQEFIDLIKEWQRSHDKAVASKLLERLKPTINSAIQTYATGATRSMLIPGAKLALEAMDTYDPSWQTDPTTHAFHNLKRLSRINGNRLALAEPSEFSRMQLKALNDASLRFEDRYNREPSLQELADLTGIPVKKINKLQDTGTVVSESATLTDDSDKDTFKKPGVTDKDYIEYLYSSVSPTDQKILEWSGGIHSKKILSNNEIAKKLGISAAAVSQRRNKLVDKLGELRGLVR